MFPRSRHEVADLHVTDIGAWSTHKAANLAVTHFARQIFVSKTITDKNQQAEFNIGMKLYYGDGMQKDLSMAFKCFQKCMLS
jgi:TPR repeat protein